MEMLNKTDSQNDMPFLEIRHLKKYFDIPGKGKLHAVDDISFNIRKNETVGLVGESGCGKSTVGKMLVHLLEATSGEVMFQGKDLLKLNKAELDQVRQKIQIIFQDPYSSLNPRKTVRAILAVPLKQHQHLVGKELEEKILELADKAGLEPYVLDMYPHELDGGKRQMVGIARALALNPEFIVCDEPVSALDVSVQATIINLLMDLQKEMNLTSVFISHDLSVVRHISDRIVVMYLGQVVEIAETDVIFEETMHPYSIALLSAVPKIEFGKESKRIVLEGDVPSPMNPKPGCRFAPRCWMACEKCALETPTLEEVEPGHFVACPYWQKSADMAEKLLAD